MGSAFSPISLPAGSRRFFRTRIHFLALTLLFLAQVPEMQAEEPQGWQSLSYSAPPGPSVPAAADVDHYLLRTGFSDDAPWNKLAKADAEWMLTALSEAQPWPIQLRSPSNQLLLMAVGPDGKQTQIDFVIAYGQCFVTMNWTVYRLSNSHFSALLGRLGIQP